MPETGKTRKTVFTSLKFVRPRFGWKRQQGRNRTHFPQLARCGPYRGGSRFVMLQKLVVARVPRGRVLAKNTFKAWDGSLLNRPSWSIGWVDTLADKHLGASVKIWCQYVRTKGGMPYHVTVDVISLDRDPGKRLSNNGKWCLVHEMGKMLHSELLDPS